MNLLARYVVVNARRTSSSHPGGNATKTAVNAAQDNEKGRKIERAWQESLVKERTNFQQCGRKELAELQNLFKTKIKKKIYKIIYLSNSALNSNNLTYLPPAENRYKSAQT